MIIDAELRIREWFKDHVATYTQHGDLKVLDWKEPGTVFYYVRYVFDGAKMYISGDMGEAVFWFTEKAELNLNGRVKSTQMKVPTTLMI